MPQQDGGRDAAGAGAEEVHVAAARDLGDYVERVQQRLDVGVEPPVALRGGRVPPADDERLEALLDEKLDQAPPRGEIGDVELVHLGRDQEDGTLEDLTGLGTVLEQLQHL